jgi:hypothetical protein
MRVGIYDEDRDAYGPNLHTLVFLAETAAACTIAATAAAAVPSPVERGSSIAVV